MLSPALPPLARAVLDALREGVVVLDTAGKLVYANEAARRSLGGRGEADVARLAALGGRSMRLRSGTEELGQAVFFPSGNGTGTLADQERRAIVDTLGITGGKLAETARRLGISRTTLWRRLKAYGIR